MLFALMAFDKSGALDLRKDNRQAHLDYIGATGVVRQAGPLLDTKGEMCGSLLILEVDSLAAAQAWAKNDPYAKAGVFERVDIRQWNRVIGE